MLYRKHIRTVLNSTETTRETDSITATPLALAMTTSDALYLGFHEPFGTRYFYFDTANTNSITVSVDYWDGSDWTAVEDLVDETLGFRQDGFLSWQNSTSWQKKALSPVSDVELFWVKITVSGSLHASTSLQAVLNLFCDDRSVAALYPELISDTRYLPEGREDFVEQYKAAKDLVVLRLKQANAIRDESQILDINEVNLAAVHASAYIILFPIGMGDEDKREKAREAYKAMDREITQARHSFDLDNSGTIVEDVEEDIGVTFYARI